MHLYLASGRELYYNQLANMCCISHHREWQQEEFNMNKRKIDTRYMALLGALCAVLLVMQLTGIGLIPLPGFKLTIMHVPVILGAIVLGTRAGAVLGCVFGLCSLWANTTAPAVSSISSKFSHRRGSFFVMASGI